MMQDPFLGLPAGSVLMAAFSGGVDSSVAAHLALEAGYRVRAVSMSVLGKECFPREKVEAAADRLGIPLDILELSEEFESTVMRCAWEEYASGRTPNPCALCNVLFKFGILADFAQKHGCAGLVTGHYARILRDPDGSIHLLRGVDPRKDQSYFLFGLSPETLAFARLPLGGLEKTRVRQIASSLGLPNADAPDSQDVCFAPPDGSSIGRMLQAKFGASAVTGSFVSSEGKILGQHDGIHAYTIGQRKGTGVAMGKPAYVKWIDPRTGNVCLTTDKTEIFADGAILTDPNFLREEYAERESFECMVKIRYRSRSVPATLYPLPDGTLRLKFREAQRAVTPGQAAVFYDGDELLGGAWIQTQETIS